MQLKLIIKKNDSKELSETTLDVQERVVIGRHVSSPVVLAGEALSRQHFALAAEGEQLTLENLSSNGTWLNGTALTAKNPMPVASGDMLEIPGYEIRIEWMTQENNADSSAENLQSATAEPSTPVWRRVMRGAAEFFDPIEALLLVCAIASITLAIYYFTS